MARMDSKHFTLAAARARRGPDRAGFPTSRGAGHPMKNFQPISPARPDAQTAAACIVCQKPLVDGQWFCRLTQSNSRTADSQTTKISLCSPSCACRYFALAEIAISQM